MDLELILGLLLTMPIFIKSMSGFQYSTSKVNGYHIAICGTAAYMEYLCCAFSMYTGRSVLSAGSIVCVFPIWQARRVSCQTKLQLLPSDSSFRVNSLSFYQHHNHLTLHIINIAINIIAINIHLSHGQQHHSRYGSAMLLPRSLSGLDCIASRRISA